MDVLEHHEWLLLWRVGVIHTCQWHHGDWDGHGYRLRASAGEKLHLPGYWVRPSFVSSHCPRRQVLFGAHNANVEETLGSANGRPVAPAAVVRVEELVPVWTELWTVPVVSQHLRRFTNSDISIVRARELPSLTVQHLRHNKPRGRREPDKDAKNHSRPRPPGFQSHVFFFVNPTSLPLWCKYMNGPVVYRGADVYGQPTSLWRSTAVTHSSQCLIHHLLKLISSSLQTTSYLYSLSLLKLSLTYETVH